MEKQRNGSTKITVGDLELWTAPFGENKATITAVEGGAKRLLLHLHQRLPDVFELFVDDEEFCAEDMDGAFSVIVDPEVVNLTITPGYGNFAFGVNRPCDGDCEHCEYNDCEDKEEANG